VIYARNANGQVTGVTSKQNATAAVVNVATGMTYAPLSNLLTALNHGNGLTTTAGYDLDYRLTALTLKNGAANVSSLAYAYGDGMNLTGITDNVTPANSVALWYSGPGSLQYASSVWGASNYYYDVGGNRTYDINAIGGVTTTKTTYYDTISNHMTSTWNGTTQLRSFSYDAGGNITNDNRPGEAFVFAYNNRNRMASVTRNAVAYATYGYNALEQLTTRSTAAVGGPVGQVAYIYDLDGHLIAEATASTGATTRDYIWAAANDNTPVDLPLAVAEAATLYMVHSDHLGRPIRMTDGAKATVWQAQYKPWGEPVTISGTKAQNLRFPGQYFQIETGFAYNWNRHYDPTTGHYTQPDPLRFVDGPSMYAYAGSSPFMRTDRDGNQVIIIDGGNSPVPFPGGGFGLPGQIGGGYCGKHFVCLPPETAAQQFDRYIRNFQNNVSGIYGMCKRAFGYGGGGGGDDDGDCDAQMDKELAFCKTRFANSALPGAARACRERASDRSVICKRNARTGGNDTMPPPWSEADEEVWRNFGR
jgi:RHS repeat-associated protein